MLLNFYCKSYGKRLKIISNLIFCQIYIYILVGQFSKINLNSALPLFPGCLSPMDISF